MIQGYSRRVSPGKCPRLSRWRHTCDCKVVEKACKVHIIPSKRCACKRYKYLLLRSSVFWTIESQAGSASIEPMGQRRTGGNFAWKWLWCHKAVPGCGGTAGAWKIWKLDEIGHWRLLRGSENGKNLTASMVPPKHIRPLACSLVRPCRMQMPNQIPAPRLWVGKISLARLCPQSNKQREAWLDHNHCRWTWWYFVEFWRLTRCH